MYVKVTSGTAVPYGLAQLQRDHPTVSFPKRLTEDLAADWGLVPLRVLPPPPYDPLTETCRELPPQPDVGGWTQGWEIARRPEAETAGRVRAERDRRLAACDWVVIRAKELGQAVPLEWFTYRSNLRQLPQQPGFPFEVSWPMPPH